MNISRSLILLPLAMEAFCPCGNTVCRCTKWCFCGISCRKCETCIQLTIDEYGFFPGYLIQPQDREAREKSEKSKSERSRNEASEDSPTTSASSLREPKQSSQSTKDPNQSFQSTVEPKQSPQSTVEPKQSLAREGYCPCGDVICRCTHLCVCNLRSCKNCETCMQHVIDKHGYHPGYLIQPHDLESRQKSWKSKSKRSRNEASEDSPTTSASSLREHKQSSESTKDPNQSFQSTAEPKQSPQTSRSTVQVSSTANYKTASITKCVNPDGSIQITFPTEFVCWRSAAASESIQSSSPATLSASNEDSTKSKTTSDNSSSMEPQLAEFKDLSLTQSTGSDSSIEVISEDEDAGQIPVHFIGDPSGVITLNNPQSQCEKPLCKKSDTKEHLSKVSSSPENISLHSSSPEIISVHSSSPEHLSADSSYRLSADSSPEHLSDDSYPDESSKNSSPEHLSYDSTCP